MRNAISLSIRKLSGIPRKIFTIVLISINYSFLIHLLALENYTVKYNHKVLSSNPCETFLPLLGPGLTGSLSGISVSISDSTGCDCITFFRSTWVGVISNSVIYSNLFDCIFEYNVLNLAKSDIVNDCDIISSNNPSFIAASINLFITISIFCGDEVGINFIHSSF